MRFLTTILLLLSSSAFAESIPPRDPFLGESRPSWWWNIWHGRVVVLEGKITFKEYDEPDIRIEIHKDRIKDIIPDDNTRELQSKVGEFYVGELEISKFHYADAGASDVDGTIEQMQSGALKRVKVLIPIMRFGNNMTLYGMNLRPDIENTGIHVFDYSNLIFGVNLNYRSKIPKESLADAQEVFKLRNKLGHTGVNRSLPPNRGYAGFLFKIEGDAVVVGSVINGSPADKADLRDGDVIHSLNGESIADPNLGVPEKLTSIISKWKVDDEIEIEVQRGDERHELRLKLFSAADLQERMQSEQDGTEQPATPPESDSEGNDKPQPESEGRSR
jgi:hypothetical protein